MKKEFWKNFGISVALVAFAFGIGLIFKDELFIGSLLLACSLIQTFFTARGKWYQYFFGFAGIIFSGIIHFNNGLYASAIFSICIFMPLAVYSLISWKKNQQNKKVIVRNLKFKITVFVILGITAGSLLIGWLVSFIPGQNISFLDATSNILNITGTILIALRFLEGWIVWIMCNIVDITMWLILINKIETSNAQMVIINFSYLYFLQYIRTYFIYEN